MKSDIRADITGHAKTRVLDIDTVPTAQDLIVSAALDRSRVAHWPPEHRAAGSRYCLQCQRNEGQINHAVGRFLFQFCTPGAVQHSHLLDLAIRRRATAIT